MCVHACVRACMRAGVCEIWLQYRDPAHYVYCKNLTLNNGDCVSYDLDDHVNAILSF